MLSISNYVSFGLLFLFLQNVGANESPQLEAVFVVIRHGDRTPTSFYPNDPFRNESFWPEGVGELNQAGIQRMSQAGLLYRKTYSQFLNETKGWPIYVKSSIRKRTIDSVELFLKSFLENDKVNVSEMVKLDQKMLTTTYKCDKSNQAWLQFFSSKTVTDYINSKNEGIKYLEEKTGDKYLDQFPFILRNLEFLATTLEIERDEYHLNVPEWARNKSTIDLMSDLKKHAYLFDWQIPTVQRFRVGPLLGDITSIMWQIIHENGFANKQRFYLYSTHDVNQVVLLQSLGLYDQIGLWPTSYSSAIVFELYHQKEQYYVRTLYREIPLDSTLSDGHYVLRDTPLNITSCNDFSWTFDSTQTSESLCSHKRFQTLIAGKVPRDYDKECRTSSAEYTSVSWAVTFIVLLFTYLHQ
ncbi:hypothetical protein RDWZM_009417 [Blomia tropicalis]|uniref:acid phosphatase n=1 Tax=Blomia tropicalis TaxID=40697 RepID=A0A9Q0RLA7_BLOTA|nr:hypothetical protein BLOT_004941 [Blomia tropicalis]KAJ6218260.1 hypothetical protein RDWZM_009417 [Blomia tropicalis]